jgi:5-methylcytosine-specific restriction endonuclease McrA/orotate phosphoribosyltransferase-like protein
MTDRDQLVKGMLEQGRTRTSIAVELRLDWDTVARIAARVGFPSKARRPSSVDWPSVREFYASGQSAAACMREFGFSASTWDAAICRGDIVPRPSLTQGAHPGITRRRVAELHEAGARPGAIAGMLGVSVPTVCYHLRKLGVKPREGPARRFDWEEIRRDYESGLTVRQCMQKYGFCSSTWSDAVRRGAVVPRPKEMPLEALLVAGRTQTSRGHLKSRLIGAGLKENRCEGCGIVKWKGKPLSMELHHINGDGKDNRLENLQLLCGNCHSQTDNWGGRGTRRNGNRCKGE